MESYFIDKTFDKINKENVPVKGEYENCIFMNGDFSSLNLSDYLFVKCRFISCNLSLIKTNKTAFRDIKFKDCKLLGIHFESCNEFGLAFNFENCTLNHSSFYRTKIKKTIYRNCQMQEVDFTECDLTSSVFDSCDLTGAVFENTILEKADFGKSFNYSIDPENNRIKKAKFSLMEIGGLLDKYDIEIVHP